MNTKSTLSLRKLSLTVVATLLLAAAPGRAKAAFLFTLTQTGGNVVVNGSGTLNLTALSFSGFHSSYASMQPNIADLFAGPTSMPNYSVYAVINGPGSFGPGTLTLANSGSGSFVGVDANFYLIVPAFYVSGTALTNTATFNNTTFATLGFTPGTYTYTWGTGVNADSLTVTSVVPEPSTWAFTFGGLTVLLLRWRRARA